MATSTLVITARKEAIKNTKKVKNSKNGKNNENNENNKNGKYLEQILHKFYVSNILSPFQKKFVLALLDLKNVVNAIYLTFAKELGFSIQLTDVGAQKIDGNTLDTYEMIVVAFLVID